MPTRWLMDFDSWVARPLSLSPRKPSTANTHGRHFVVFGRLSRSPRQSSLSLYSIRFDLKLFDFPGPPKVFDCLLICAPGNCREVSSASSKGWASRNVGVSPGKCWKSAKNSIIGLWESSTSFLFPLVCFSCFSPVPPSSPCSRTVLVVFCGGIATNSVCVRGGHKRENRWERFARRLRVSRSSSVGRLVMLSPERATCEWKKRNQKSTTHNYYEAKTTTQRNSSSSSSGKVTARKRKRIIFAQLQAPREPVEKRVEIVGDDLEFSAVFRFKSLT